MAERPARLRRGQAAPEFLLADQDGRQVSLADLRGQVALLFFYSEAETPDCTLQAETLRDSRQELLELGVSSVVGISPDPPEVQKRFRDDHDLGFLLLSDTERSAARSYGVWKEDRAGPGRFVRSAFLLAADGSLIDAWYGVRPRDTAVKVVFALPSA
jgi:peroxiredoxin Q/BCP